MSLIRLLTEGDYGNEYRTEASHFTTIDSLHSILKEDKLRAQVPNDVISFPEDYKDDEHFKRVSLSVTDDINFMARAFGYIRIVIDLEKLEVDYSPKQYADPSLSKNQISKEREIIILEDIENLHTYIKKIEFISSRLDNYNKKDFMKFKKEYPEIKFIGV